MDQQIVDPLVDEKIKYNKGESRPGFLYVPKANADLKVRMCNNRRSRYDDGIQAGIGFAKEWMQKPGGRERVKGDLLHRRSLTKIRKAIVPGQPLGSLSKKRKKAAMSYC